MRGTDVMSVLPSPANQWPACTAPGTSPAWLPAHEVLPVVPTVTPNGLARIARSSYGLLMRARREGDRTFTENARRAQIVRAAIETIGELGYRATALARIAERAGLSSTGMISYHFRGKDDLMHAVMM